MELKLAVLLLLLLQIKKFTYGVPIDSDSGNVEEELVKGVEKGVLEAEAAVNGTELSDDDKFDEERRYIPTESSKVINGFNETIAVTVTSDATNSIAGTILKTSNKISENINLSNEKSLNAVKESNVKASESSNATESVVDEKFDEASEVSNPIIRNTTNAINQTLLESTIPESNATTSNSTKTFAKMYGGRRKQKPEAKLLPDSASINAVNPINETTPETSLNATSETFNENPLDDLSIPLPIEITLKPPKAVTDNGVILPNKLENETLPEWFTKDRYLPSKLPEMNNKVFNEFMRLSKLTQYMLLDPKFAEDYQKALTYSGPPIRKSRIRFRIKSLNDKPPIKCSEMGRETARLFCPFSYGYRWWDCLMPDEVCDGIPHCGLGDDEDPKMCLYYKAALSQFQRAQHTVEAAQSRQQQIRPSGHKAVMYNPADEI
uniref:Uncharacterized protein n=1 Tax=Panagrolaimus davidi TaxID=227884 RepID=A0A914PT66_9BILA